MTFRNLSNLLAAIMATLAVLAPIHAFPVSSTADTVTDLRCSGSELALHPAHLHDLRSISRRLHERAAVSAAERRMWRAARVYLKGEVRSSRCVRGEDEQLCCMVCRAGQKSLLCSHSSLIRDSEGVELADVNESVPASRMKSLPLSGEDEAEFEEAFVSAATEAGERNSRDFLRFARYAILLSYWLTLGLFAATCDKRTRDELSASPSVLHFVLCASLCVVFSMCV